MTRHQPLNWMLSRVGIWVNMGHPTNLDLAYLALTLAFFLFIFFLYLFFFLVTCPTPFCKSLSLEPWLVITAEVYRNTCKKSCHASVWGRNEPMIGNERQQKLEQFKCAKDNLSSSYGWEKVTPELAVRPHNPSPLLSLWKSPPPLSLTLWNC